MKIHVIKRKPTSYRNLSDELMEVGHPKTVLELLMNVMKSQIEFLYTKNETIDNNTIQDMVKSGKVQFEQYGVPKEVESLKTTLIQDFKDGLFRVYINEEEYMDLYTSIDLKETDTLVLIKLVMLTGRLW